MEFWERSYLKFVLTPNVRGSGSDGFHSAFVVHFMIHHLASMRAWCGTVELGFQQFEEHFFGVWTVLLLVWKNSLRRVYAPRYLTIKSYPTVYLLVKHSQKHQPT